MSAEITPPSTPDAYQLRGPVDAMRWLIIHFDELPAPYVAMHASSTGRTRLLVQLQDPAHFEMWREALELDAEDVRLCTDGESSWLAVDGMARTATVGGWRVPVELTGHGLPLAAVDAAAVAR